MITVKSTWGGRTHSATYRVPDWVQRFDHERLACGHEGCASRPFDHRHLTDCDNDQPSRHHDWIPESGSFADHYARSL